MFLLIFVLYVRIVAIVCVSGPCLVVVLMLLIYVVIFYVVFYVYYMFVIMIVSLYYDCILVVVESDLCVDCTVSLYCCVIISLYDPLTLSRS